MGVLGRASLRNIDEFRDAAGDCVEEGSIIRRGTEISRGRKVVGQRPDRAYGGSDLIHRNRTLMRRDHCRGQSIAVSMRAEFSPAELLALPPGWRRHSDCGGCGRTAIFRRY